MQFHAVERVLGLTGRGGSPLYGAFRGALERAGLTLEQAYQDPSRAGVLAYGATRDEAVARVEALALRVLADRLEHGEPVPELDALFVAA